MLNKLKVKAILFFFYPNTKTNKVVYIDFPNHPLKFIHIQLLDQLLF